MDGTHSESEGNERGLFLFSCFPPTPALSGRWPCYNSFGPVKGGGDTPQRKLMCTYMLCIWWVCICGSNVSGGEHVGLNTKAGFACGSSPLPVLLACLVLSLLAPACLSALTPTNCAGQDQQLSHKGVKATGSQFIHSSLTTQG